MQVDRTTGSPLAGAASRSLLVTPMNTATAPARPSPLVTPMDILVQQAQARVAAPAPAAAAASSPSSPVQPGIELLKGNLLNVVA